MIEKIILSHMIGNEPFMRKVIPYIKKEYFQDLSQQVIFDLIEAYVNKYNSMPSKEALRINLTDVKINDEQQAVCDDLIAGLKVDPKTDFQWIYDQTEKWCQNRAFYLALTKCLEIYDGEGKEDLGVAPKLMTDALGVSFDSHIGNDFFEDAEARFEYYHRLEHKVPFNLSYFNHITRGGASKKSLTIFMAGVNVGKSAMMCSLAANHLNDGHNVLYITLEMSEEEIQKRIEANLMDLTIDQVNELDKEVFLRNIENIKKMTGGTLKVKEYPTKQGGAAHFRFLLNELKLKTGFVPEVIYLDYLNICMSSTLKAGKASMYEYVKAISEEIRGLAVEFNVPIITATQFNRDGFRSSDPGMDDVSESFGTTATADLILALVRNEEMDSMGQIMVTQLKNRYSNKAVDARFVLGVDIEKMQFYDAPNTAQTLMGQRKDFKNGNEPLPVKEKVVDNDEPRSKFSDIFE